MIKVGIHKVHDDVISPCYMTEKSACFDVFAYVKAHMSVKIFHSDHCASAAIAGPDDTVQILPGEIALIPTGIIFDIPAEYSVRLHPRSGLSLKAGLVLQNCEGIIDSDYVQETLVMLKNTSRDERYIKFGDRICQGEIVPLLQADFYACEKPAIKTSRKGGFGSTGK